ncbi:hypothetical protein ACXH7K_002014 [Klebsiella variicola]
MLLGKYIQMYCFIELNIHRLFNKLVSEGVITIKTNKKVSVPYILDKLIDLVNLNLVESSRVDDVIAKLKEIKYRRDYRNIFAHWAAKKIPNEDGMIFFTGDALDYKKVLNKKIDPQTVAYTIFDVADIRGLVNHINDYEEWLAHFYAEIYERYKKTS